MGNLCSSGSERVDKKEENRITEKLKDGEDEALLPKVGAGVRMVAGEGYVDAGGGGSVHLSGFVSGGVESVSAASKVLENGQCVMAGGRTICPEIVVSGSDVETVEDDDDDFLNSVIAVSTDSAGRGTHTAARGVGVDATEHQGSQSEDVSFAEEVHGLEHHGEAAVNAVVDADYSGAVGAMITSNRKSVSTESGNWSDSVVRSATTAAEIAISGTDFAIDDFRTEVTRKEESFSISVEEGVWNNVVGVSSDTDDTTDQVPVPTNAVERREVSGKVSGWVTDGVTTVTTSTDDIHRVVNTPSKTVELNNDVTLSRPLLTRAGVFDSPVATLVGNVKLLAEDEEQCEQRVLGEASSKQEPVDDVSPDVPLSTSAGSNNCSSSGHQKAIHDDERESPVDAQMSFRATRQRVSDTNDQLEQNTPDKNDKFADVSSSLEAEIGQPGPSISSEKQAGSVVDTADQTAASMSTRVETTVGNNSSSRRDDVLSSTLVGPDSQTLVTVASSSTQQRHGETQIQLNPGAASSCTKHESDDLFADDHSLDVARQGTEDQEDTEVTLGGDTSDTASVVLAFSPQTVDEHRYCLDRSRSQPEADNFADWSIACDADFSEGYVKTAEDLNHEAAAREIVESIIAKATSIVCGIQMGPGMEDSFLAFVDREEETLVHKHRAVMCVSLPTSDTASSSVCSTPQVLPPPPPETDQSPLVESVTGSISESDLTDEEELLIPPVSSAEVYSEIERTHIFSSSSDDDDDDESIKQTAWGITDKAVQEAIKIVAENGCCLDSGLNQPQNNNADSCPTEEPALPTDSSHTQQESSRNDSTETPTHENGGESQAAVMSDDQSSSQTTPAEDTLPQSLSHTNKPHENDPMDIPENSIPSHPVTPSDFEPISSPSPPISNGDQRSSDSNPQTSPPYFSKVPSFFPPLDNFSSLPDKPMIIINSPDSAGHSGSTEDISVHAEELI